MSDSHFSGAVDSAAGFKVGGTTVIDSDGKIVESAGLEFSDGDSLPDNNGAELVEFGVTASAVNHVHISNDATGSEPDIAAVGDDTNIGLGLATKGTGKILLKDPVAYTNADTISAAGAVSLTASLTYVDSTAGVMAITLADGIVGQEKFLVMTADGGDATLTPTNLTNGTTLTFDDVGDSAHLVFMNDGWVSMGGTATLA